MGSYNKDILLGGRVIITENENIHYRYCEKDTSTHQLSLLSSLSLLTWFPNSRPADLSHYALHIIEVEGGLIMSEGLETAEDFSCPILS